jgi:hypothetical protein
MIIPLAKLDLSKTRASVNTGGFAGAHGIDLATVGDDITVRVDEGEPSNSREAVLAFGTTKQDEKRAVTLAKALKRARAACSK